MRVMPQAIGEDRTSDKARGYLPDQALRRVDQRGAEVEDLYEVEAAFRRVGRF